MTFFINIIFFLIIDRRRYITHARNRRFYYNISVSVGVIIIFFFFFSPLRGAAVYLPSTTRPGQTNKIYRTRTNARIPSKTNSASPTGAFFNSSDSHGGAFRILFNGGVGMVLKNILFTCSFALSRHHISREHDGWCCYYHARIDRAHYFSKQIIQRE